MENRQSGLLQNIFPLIFGAALTLTLALVLSFNIISAQQFSLQVGQRAEFPIFAPRDTEYESEVLTNERIEQVTANIYEYTPLNRSIGREQANQARAVFNFVEVVRADALADTDTKVNYLTGIETITLEPTVAQSLIQVTGPEYNRIKNEVINIITEVMRDEVREDELSVAQRDAIRLISLELTQVQEQVVSSLTPQFVRPNTFFDEAATAQARQLTADGVDPVVEIITEEQLILQVGEQVTPYHLEALEQLGLLQQTTDWFSVGDNFIVAFLSAMSISLYWWRFHRGINRAPRYLIILGLLVVIFAIIAKFLAPLNDMWVYVFPACAMAMLVSVIYNNRLAVLLTFVMAALYGYIGNNSFEMAVFAGVGALFAILALPDVQRFYTLFRAGFVGGAVNVLVVLLFELNANTEPIELIFPGLVGFAAGFVLSPLLTIAGFFLVGLFGVLTVVQLQDLARLDHPLLKELLRRAPGTYHHSLMVANLAEQAAENVGANGALVRVGSFYHDIGKMNRPAFFTENQEGGSNPHEKLDPFSSARIIKAHVSDGLEMARRHRLPDRIQDFIAEHHGTSLIKVFLERAKEQADDPESIDLALFRYAGPRPKTREAGIVLLADTVEAASSAVRPSTEEEIILLVNSLVDSHLQAGQLDDSDLTMGDIETVRRSFIETLKGRFHLRVRYPGNEKLVASDKGAADGGATAVEPQPQVGQVEGASLSS